MPPPDFSDRLADLWTPSESVESDGTVNTASYALAQASVPCDWQPMPNQDKVWAGLDPDANVRLYCIAGWNLMVDRIPQKTILYDATDGSYYEVKAPPNQFTTVSNQWSFVAQQNLTPPRQLIDFYAGQV